MLILEVRLVEQTGLLIGEGVAFERLFSFGNGKAERPPWWGRNIMHPVQTLGLIMNTIIYIGRDLDSHALCPEAELYCWLHGGRGVPSEGTKWRVAGSRMP